MRCHLVLPDDTLDPVFGEPVRGGYPLCEDARGDGQPCGPPGRLFEVRPNGERHIPIVFKA